MTSAAWAALKYNCGTNITVLVPANLCLQITDYTNHPIILCSSWSARNILEKRIAFWCEGSNDTNFYLVFDWLRRKVTWLDNNRFIMVLCKCEVVHITVAIPTPSIVVISGVKWYITACYMPFYICICIQLPFCTKLYFTTWLLYNDWWREGLRGWIPINTCNTLILMDITMEHYMLNFPTFAIILQ